MKKTTPKTRQKTTRTPSGTIADAAPVPAAATDPAPVPAPAHDLTPADRESLAAMPFIEDAGDLSAIPEGRRARALHFLRLYADGKLTRDAQREAGVQPWELTVCRRVSQTFREAFELVQASRFEDFSAAATETLAKLSAGDFIPKDGCLTPDVRAASLMLPAIDPARFSPKAGQAMPAVSISISI